MEIDPSCEKSRDEQSQATVPRPQIIVKSFDMPNIDCDEQVVEPIVIKQEADETVYEDYSYRCEPTSTTEKPKCQDLSKKHIVEKSHLGIENVVEKLKKSAAAALQETAFRKMNGSNDKNAENLHSRKHSETIPRRVENGLKKHILRSCENSQFMEKYEVAREPEVSSSENARSAKDSQDVPNYVTTTEHPCDSPTFIPSPPACNHPLPIKYFLNSTNNDTRSNNDNVELNDDKEPVVKEENVSIEVCEMKTECTDNNAMTPKKGQFGTLDNSSPLTINSETPKSRLFHSRPRPIVDFSGLELLSNSIEEFQRLRSNGSRRAELERSAIKGRVIFPPEETCNINHCNNVNSPLGLLCALAEQRFMEEVVGDRTSGRSNLENSEEISHAGRLLLNLGRANVPENETKTSDKRKYVQEHLDDTESLKRFKIDGELKNDEYESYSEDDDCDKQYDEDEGEVIMSGMAEHLREIEDFSEEEDISVDDDEDGILKDAPLSTSSPCNNVNFEGEEDFEEYERKAYEQYHMSETYSSKGSLDDYLSDSDDEMYDEKMCLDDKMEENGEDSRCEDRRHILEEHRDCHDYRNLQAKLDAKKFIAKKGHIDNDADWPNMDATELDMRVRLADIQRQYREKQKELSKLIPKKDEKKIPGRPRKKSHSSR